MDRNLIVRRDAAFDKHSEVLNRFPGKSGEQFAREMAGVVTDLSAVVAATSDACDPFERGKAYRYLGDAYCDLGVAGSKARAWREGAVAYLTAERLMREIDSPVEKAKLDFNFGNTTAALADGVDVGLLEAAAERYQRAAGIFRKNMLSHFVRVVEERVALLSPQLGFARAGAAMVREIDRLERLLSELQKAGPLERDRIGADTRKCRQALASIIADLPALAKQARAALSNAVKLGLVSWAQSAELDKAEATFEQAAQTARVAASADCADCSNGTATEDPLFLLAILIQQTIGAQAAAGEVTSDRASYLQVLLREFLGKAPRDGDSLDLAIAKVGAMRELMAKAADTLHSASWLIPPPLAGSRAERLCNVIGPLKQYVVAEMLRSMLPHEEAMRAVALFAEASSIEAAIREAAGDEVRLTELEERLWRVALNVQNFMRRYHILVAKPDLPVLAPHGPVRSLFVSGGETLRVTAAALATREKLTLLDKALGQEVAEERWRQLLSASVCAFDIGEANSETNMQATYELGLALVVGKPCILTTRSGRPVPFDVEQPVVVFDDAPDRNLEQLTQALYATLANVASGGRATQFFGAGKQALEELAAHATNALAPSTLRHQLESARINLGDAVALWRSLEQIVGALGAKGPALFRPRWPPDGEVGPGRPKCFHVTPFHKSFDSVCEALREICTDRGWQYVRGDMGASQRIMHRIWHGICQASAAVIDVTGRNLNVGLELGLVHAVGKPYKLLCQGEALTHTFPSIGKVHIHAYPNEALAEIVAPLLTPHR